MFFDWEKLKNTGGKTIITFQCKSLLAELPRLVLVHQGRALLVTGLMQPLRGTAVTPEWEENRRWTASLDGWATQGNPEPWWVGRTKETPLTMPGAIRGCQLRCTLPIFVLSFCC